MGGTNRYPLRKMLPLAKGRAASPPAPPPTPAPAPPTTPPTPTLLVPPTPPPLVLGFLAAVGDRMDVPPLGRDVPLVLVTPARTTSVDDVGESPPLPLSACRVTQGCSRNCSAVMRFEGSGLRQLQINSLASLDTDCHTSATNEKAARLMSSNIWRR
jgi:hypothetical protein